MFDADTFVDFVASHGFGGPTAEGMAIGRILFADARGDYATAAAELVCRGWTTDPDGCAPPAYPPVDGLDAWFVPYRTAPAVGPIWLFQAYAEDAAHAVEQFRDAEPDAVLAGDPERVER